MKKNKVTGLVGTIVLHVVLLLLLLLVAISKPKAQEEGGVPVMLGNMEMAQGNADPYTLTDVDILDEPQLPSEVSAPEPVPTPPVKTEMITQEDEPTIAVPKKETPKPTVKKETIKKETPKKNLLNQKKRPKLKSGLKQNAWLQKRKLLKKELRQKLQLNVLLVLLEKERRWAVKVMLMQVKVCKVAQPEMRRKENLRV